MEIIKKYFRKLRKWTWRSKKNSSCISQLESFALPVHYRGSKVAATFWVLETRHWTSRVEPAMRICEDGFKVLSVRNCWTV